MHVDPGASQDKSLNLADFIQRTVLLLSQKSTYGTYGKYNGKMQARYVAL